MAELGLEPRPLGAPKGGLDLPNTSLLPQASSWILRPQFLAGNSFAEDYQIPIAAAENSGEHTP